MLRTSTAAMLLLACTAVGCSKGVPGTYKAQLDLSVMEQKLAETPSPQREILEQLLDKMRGFEGQFEFHADGTFDAKMNGQPTASGTWILEGERLTLSGGAKAAGQQIVGTFAAGEITLADGSGNMVLTRTPASPR